MKNLRHAMRGPLTASGSELYLGLVILPQPDRGPQALAALADVRGLELAEPTNHRIPAFARVPTGNDEALLAEIAGMPDIAGVDVVFAQLVKEDSE